MASLSRHAVAAADAAEICVSDILALGTRALLTDTRLMKAANLIRRLRRLATKRGWHIEIKEGGSHTKVSLNGRQATVPRHAKDIGTGLFQAIRKQLGLSPEDLEN